MPEKREPQNTPEETLGELLATDINLIDKIQLEELLRKLTARISEIKGLDHPEHGNAVQAGEMVDQIRRKLEL